MTSVAHFKFNKHRRSLSRDIRTESDQTPALVWEHQSHADQKLPAIYSWNRNIYLPFKKIIGTSVLNFITPIPDDKVEQNSQDTSLLIDSNTTDIVSGTELIDTYNVIVSYR